jgi:hypothetical protein
MPFNFPVEVKCLAKTDKWTTGRTLAFNRRVVVLKNLQIWFSKGCSGLVYVRLKLGDTLFLPANSGVANITPADPSGVGLAYFGDDTVWRVHHPHEFTQSEILTIEYINADPSADHQIGIHFEMVLTPPRTSVDTEGTGTGRRPQSSVPRMKEHEEKDLGTEVSVQSPSADRRPMPKSYEEELMDAGRQREGQSRWRMKR